MSWHCLRCDAKNQNSFKHCYECLKLGVRVKRLFRFEYYCSDGILAAMSDEYRFNILRISREARGKPLNPKEELYAKLFNHETVLVSDMDDLTLCAHVDELQKIAYEANVRYAVSKEEKDKRNSKKNPKTFHTAIEMDDASRNAINTVKKRQEKLSLYDKMHANLMKIPGMTEEVATQTLSAGRLLEIKNKSVDKSPIPLKFENTPAQKVAVEIAKAEEKADETLEQTKIEKKKPFKLGK